MWSRGSRRAFSLRDLLVAMTIIVVLLSLLIPSIGKARRAARRAECLSNQRSLVNSSRMFSNDNRGQLYSVGSGTGYYWVTALTQYNEALTPTASHAKKVMLCGEASSTRNAVGTASYAWGPNYAVAGGYNVGGYAGSYGINGWAYGNNKTAAPSIVCGSGNFQGLTIDASVLSPGPVTFQAQSYEVTGSVTANPPPANSVNIAGGTSSTNTLPPALKAKLGQIGQAIEAMYAQVTSSPGVVVLDGSAKKVALDFTAGSVLWVKGDADLAKAEVKGTGTLVVDGDVNGLPDGSYNVLTLGNLNAKNFVITGGVYVKGNVSGSAGNGQNGGFDLTGVLLVGGNISCNGATKTWTAGPAAPFDTFTTSLTASTSLNLATVNPSQTPLFGDCIWSDAWPKTGDVAKLETIDVTQGDANIGLGRFYIDRHGGKTVNIGFLDGSAQTVKLHELKDLKWSPSF